MLTSGGKISGEWIWCRLLVLPPWCGVVVFLTWVSPRPPGGRCSGCWIQVLKNVVTAVRIWFQVRAIEMAAEMAR